jgi:uncharacterized membrane protein
MSHTKSFGLAIFAAVCLLGEATGSAHAQCDPLETICATEWSGGDVINLGGLPGSMNSDAFGINSAGHAVGASSVGGIAVATEWSGGAVVNLGGLPGSMGSVADSINNVG